MNVTKPHEAFSPHRSSPEPEKKLDKRLTFEYNGFEFNTITWFQKQANIMGAEGWELVSVVNIEQLLNKAFFKRRTG